MLKFAQILELPIVAFLTRISPSQLSIIPKLSIDFSAYRSGPPLYRRHFIFEMFLLVTGWYDDLGRETNHRWNSMTAIPISCARAPTSKQTSLVI